MELQVLDQNSGEVKSQLDVSDGVFAVDFNEDLVHQVVVAYMNKQRAGTKAQKNRSAVSGGGAKPFRQKGTGRARAGTTRAPHWVGGGRAFAAKPRNYSQKVNRKMYRAAMRSILSRLIQEDRLVVVDDFNMESPKTKEFVAKMKALNVKDALFVLDTFDDLAYLGSRNLYNASVADFATLDPVSMIGYEKVVMTAGVVKKIEEWLS